MVIEKEKSRDTHQKSYTELKKTQLSGNDELIDGSDMVSRVSATGFFVFQT